MLRLRGMISTFTASDTSHPLVKYLMLSDSERANAVTPMAELCAMARAELADPKQTFSFSLRDTNPLMDARARDLIALFLDFMWDKTQSGDARVDMRMTVPDTTFLQLLDEYEEGVGKGLRKSESGENPGGGEGQRERQFYAGSNGCTPGWGGGPPRLLCD